MKALAMLALLFASGISAPAAPAPPASTSDFTIEEDAVTCRAVFVWRDLEALLPLDDNGDRVFGDREFQSWREDLASLGEVFFAVYRGDEPLLAESVTLAQSAGRAGTIEFTILYPAPAISTWESVDVAFESLPDFPDGHRHRLKVISGGGDLLLEETLTVTEPLSPDSASLTSAKPTPATRPPASPSPALSAWDRRGGLLYLFLGIPIGLAGAITGRLLKRQTTPPPTHF